MLTLIHGVHELLRARLLFPSLIGMLALSAIVGCGGASSANGSLSDTAEALGLDPDAITSIAGFKTTVEGPFDLVEGVLIMSGISSGGLFSALLKQDDELALDLVFNETTKYDGQSAIPVHSVIGALKPGPVMLEVTSSGDWTFEFTQERFTTGRSPTLAISGNGDAIIPAIDFKEGAYSISAVNEEPIGFFAVKLIKSDGSHTKSLINKTAEFSETFEFEIGRAGSVVHPAGIWTLDIDASGDWEISIR